ncbi:MAG TPA: PAS domain S-box protein [Chitinophagaceae bacterium]
MSKLLKILHLEDLQEDAEMVARALKKGGVECEIKHVEDKVEFIKALKEFSPDIILSDHSLPSFDSHEALKIVKEMGIETPFILITATVSEEYAVSIIKEGASDYILKDRLQRLPNSIAGAMEKYNLEQTRKEADETLRMSERKYKLLFESNPMPMWMVSRSTFDIIAVNEAATTHYGYTKEEFLKLAPSDLRPTEDVPAYIAHIKKEYIGTQKAGIWRHKKKDGSIIMMEIITHNIMYENSPVRLVLANDVTKKLQVEAELANQQMMREKLITETSIQVQERERDEIGKELHDNINQIMAAAKLYLDMAIKKEEKGPQLLYKAQHNIVLAINEIRKLSHTLVAPSLGPVTLIQAIEELFADIRMTTSLHLEVFTCNYNEKEIDNNVSLMFYRIVQEQINNVVKHAKAKNVAVKLSTTAENIQLTIEDDGKGFDTAKTSSGIGLRNIRNRVDYYDGSTRIISAPGEGCVLKITIPVQQNVFAQQN